MKKTSKKLIVGIAFVMLMTVLFCFTASAETWGDFIYYSDSETGTVSISDYKGKAAELTIPEKINGNVVNSISLEDNPYVKIINIPASVEDFGWAEIPFYNYTKLEKINVASKNKNYYSDKNGVLFTKDKTELIMVPANSALTTYKVPSTVKTINRMSLDGNKNIKVLKIPASVKEIYLELIGVKKLEKIVVDSENKNFSSDKYGVLFNKKKTELLCYPCGNKATSYTVPKTVKIIGDLSFINSPYLETVKLPDGLESIGSQAFYECISLKSISVPDSVRGMGNSVFGGCKKLKTVKLSSSVSIIGWSVFSDCESLEAFHIPAGLTLMADSALKGCKSIKKITVDSKNKYFTADKYGALYNKEKTKLIFYPPASSNKSYTIPASVRNFGSYALKGIANVENLTVSSKNKIYYTDQYGALFNKENKEMCMFPNNSKATSYSVPSGIKWINMRVFDNCNLEILKIPASVEELYGNSFTENSKIGKFVVDSKNKNYCSDKNGVLFNKNKTTLVRYPSAARATAYEIPKGVKDIDYKAFTCTDNLKALFIPESLEYLSKESFEYCTSLKNIYFSGTKSEWKKVDSLEESQLLKVKINCNHKHSYKTAALETATEKENGKVVSMCVCGNIKKDAETKTVYKIKTIELSKTKYTYDGKVKTPSVTVKDSKGNVLKKDTDYKVTYSKGRTAPGKYSVRIDFKGKYEGTKRLYLTIIPAKVSISKVTAGTKSAVVTWKTATGVSGYEVQYSAYENFKSAKAVTVKNSASAKKTIKNLVKDKKYFFKVRAYKTIDGNRVYGAWSAVKSVKVK